MLRHVLATANANPDISCRRQGGGIYLLLSSCLVGIVALGWHRSIAV